MILFGIEITKLPTKTDLLKDEIRDLRYEVAQQKDMINTLLRYSGNYTDQLRGVRL